MNNEYSGEIRFFRSTLQEYVEPLMQTLRDECSRLESLQAQCREEYLKKLYGKNYLKYSNPELSPKAIGRYILDFAKIVSDIKALGFSDTKTPTIELIELGKERQQSLNRLISSIREFQGNAANIIVYDATSRYAERKKFYDSVSLSSDEIGIFKPSEIVGFLSDLYSSDKKLCITFLKNWSKRFDITLFHQAFIAKDIETATIYLAGTHGGASAFAIEVTSVANGLYKLDSFSQAIKQCVSVCKKLDHKYYAKRADELGGQSLYFLKEFEAPYYSSNNLEELKNNLHAKQHLFSQSEYSAIFGEEVTPTIEQTDEPLRSVEDTSNIYIEKTDTPILTNGELARKNRVGRPPRFYGEKGERAFQLLFKQMNHVYIEDTTYENFAGLFSCLPQELEPTSYSKIKWISDGGEKSLKCFLEALYRPANNALAELPKKSALSNIFFTKTKSTIDLSDNPVYCWKRGRRAIDFNNPEEKKIMTFLGIISTVLNQA